MIVLDTDVLSQFVRKRPNPRVVLEARAVPADELYTTVVSVMELRYGSSRRDDRDRFWQRIVREILSRLRVLPFTVAAAIRAGDIQASLDAKGTPIGLADVQIAAIAIDNEATLIAGNLRHFERVANLTVASWLA